MTEENELGRYGKLKLLADLANVLVTIAGLTLCSAAQVYLPPNTSIIAGIMGALSGISLCASTYAKLSERMAAPMLAMMTLITVADAIALFRPFLHAVLA